jgi:hypothetical protein
VVRAWIYICNIVDFNELSWAAVCFYYRSVGDRQYGKVMADISFLERLRQRPQTVDPEEFERKVILDQVRVEDYNLLVGHVLAKTVLAGIVKHQSILSRLLEMSILDCNLSGTFTTDAISRVYSDIACAGGLWETGASKIMHLLNDRLFAMLSPALASTYGLIDNEFRLVEWMRFVQENARAVVADFTQQGFSGSPEAFLSEKLGYTKAGYQKSMVKFLDEYFWLSRGDGLPIPPEWIPSWHGTSAAFDTDQFEAPVGERAASTEVDSTSVLDQHRT